MQFDKDNAMLIDIQYMRPNRKMKEPDYLYIIWKDLKTGEKHLNVIPEPMINIYFEKPECRNHTYSTTYAKLEDLDCRTVKYKDIIYAIADDMGERGRSHLEECFNTGNYDGLKDLLIYPYVYGADYDIRVWYRMQWLKNYDNDATKVLDKGFLDIEVDTMESIGLPTPENDPIDLVTVIDASHKQSYTFILTGVEHIRDEYAVELRKKADEMDLSGRAKRRTYDAIEKLEEKNALYKSRLEQQKYWTSHKDELIQKAHEAFDENYPDMNYNFYFYTDERMLIVHVFQLIHKLKLDMLAAWNIAFDIPYFIERLKVLGMDPVDVMADKDFPVREAYFKKDRIHFDIKNKSDFVHISSYTIFIDQMVNYAAIRKGGPELRSNRLTYIAKKEIGDEKLDYSDFASIKTLSCKDFLTYILYNIKDVLLQMKIEEVTTDMDTYYFSSYKNVTPYEDIFKQTKMLRNVQYKSFLSQGLIPGENVNGFLYNRKLDKIKKGEEEEEEDGPGFEGALVGDPLLISEFGEEIFGKPSRSIFRYSIDMDMSAFYPSTIRAMNIDPSTLIFKMIIKPDVYDVKGGDLKFNGFTDVQLMEKNRDTWLEDIAPEIIDNYKTGNIITFAHKWLNFPTITDVYKKLKKGNDD